jgi:predicted phage tail protein
MKRKLFLEGEIAEKFGSEFTIDVSNFRDAMRLMNVNFPEFRKYLIECHSKGIEFIVQVEGISVDEEELLVQSRKGDLSLIVAPAGSKSGGAKLLAAIAIVALMLTPFGQALFFTGVGPGAGLTISGYIAAGLALNLAMTGIQQLMAPDPSTDSAAPQAYLFNGSEQNIIEGDPVPILYGELRVPGRPIGFSIANGTQYVGFINAESISIDIGNVAG